MNTLTLIVPILPGKSEPWRRFLQELSYSRRAEYEDSRRYWGITQERAWIVATKPGDIAIIAIEAEQPELVLHHLARSELPIDRTFRTQLLALQGVDMTHPAQPHADLVFEWQQPITNLYFTTERK